MIPAPLPCAASIGKLIPRLASSSDGEVLATVRAIQRQLARHGLDLHDLARAVQQPLAPAGAASLEQHLMWCVLFKAELWARELDFVETLWRRYEQAGRLSLTPRQADWLIAISDRIRQQEACHA